MISKIHSVHLEISSLCNASCPQCTRNISGGAVNPLLPLTYLNQEDVRKIFTPALLAEMEHLKICGNYGDGATAPDAIESFRYLKGERPGLFIEVHSNGGVREPDWWRQVAPLADKFVFGIDGLEDTNHLYRRGVVWSKLIRNLEAFIAAGGAAEWHFLVFKHNEHQVEEARKLAAALGVRRFSTKRTHRFFRNGGLIERQAVLDRAGQVEYYLEPPADTEARNPAMVEMIEAIGPGRTFSGFNEYVETTAIDCKTIRRRQIYVSSEGLVFPCCWTGAIYGSRNHAVRRMIERLEGGRDSINAKHRPVAEIVHGEFFRQIAASWSRPSVAEGRLKACARHCGQCDMTAATHERAEMGAPP